MERNRDAKTGEFISDEEAAQRDRSTWTKETVFDKAEFLEKVLKLITERSFEYTEQNVPDSELQVAVDLKDIEEVFSQFGLKADK